MFKKLFLIIISITLLTGCNNTLLSVENEVYYSYIDSLEKSNAVNDYIPFNIEVYVDKIIETEVMYRVIIDKPKTSLRDIEVIVIHDKYTEDIYPSSGIFESKYSLIPDVINKSSNYVEGIILVGYIPFDQELESLDATFKVLFKYKDDQGVEKEIIYSTKR